MPCACFVRNVWEARLCVGKGHADFHSGLFLVQSSASYLLASPVSEASCLSDCSPTYPSTHPLSHSSSATTLIHHLPIALPASITITMSWVKTGSKKLRWWQNSEMNMTPKELRSRGKNTTYTKSSADFYLSSLCPKIGAFIHYSLKLPFICPAAVTLPGSLIATSLSCK